MKKILTNRIGLGNRHVMVSPIISKYFSALGKKGGKAGRGKSKARSTEICRKAQAIGVENRRRRKIVKETK